MTAKKFSTGIEALDSQIGGIHPGLVILHEVVGAGGREFAISTMIKNAEKGESGLRYIAITKSEDEVAREVALTFPEANVNVLLEKLKIESLAEFYFRDSVVPLRWVSEGVTIDLLKGEKNLLSKLVEIFDGVERGSFIFLDSLTDLARAARGRLNWNDLVDLIWGLKKLCVRRDVLLLTLLTSGVFERGREEELLDIADAVFVFEWAVEKDSITRWLYFRKFLGVLPQLEKERIVKYSVKLDPALGFTISRLMRVL